MSASRSSMRSVCWMLRLDRCWLRVQVLHIPTARLVRHPRPSLLAAGRLSPFETPPRRCDRRVRVAVLVLRGLLEAQGGRRRAPPRRTSCLLLVRDYLLHQGHLHPGLYLELLPRSLRVGLLGQLGRQRLEYGLGHRFGNRVEVLRLLCLHRRLHSRGAGGNAVNGARWTNTWASAAGFHENFLLP